ncbi:MAG: hypothetical protein IPL27_00985 [Lewinellaceae bacterium]|nr:hypothetical protein [Lewinellaceae bacterium]
MITKKAPVFILCSLLALPLFSQPLQIDTTHRCLYSGTWFGTMPRQGSSSDADVEKMVDTICQITQTDRNVFQLINARVPDVAAVADGKARYLLYNRGVFQNLKNGKRAWAYFILAHEIGHHSLRHTLDPRKRLREEAEADRFAGQVMKRLGEAVSLPALQDMVNAEPYSYAGLYPAAERKAAFATGWNTVDAFNKGLSFGNNPTDIEQSPLPRFQKKGCPKECTLNAKRFEGCAKLSDIDFRICRALDAQGYTQRSYFAVKNGYALVTSAEQFKSAPALKSVAGDQRWLDYPPRPNFEGVWDYFSKMLWPNPTRFRVFVFVVTNQSVLEYVPGAVTADGCKEWLKQGGNVLPDYLAREPVKGHTVRGLVYEFWAEESNKTAKEECRQNVRAEDHLQKSGILELIKK